MEFSAAVAWLERESVPVDAAPTTTPPSVVSRAAVGPLRPMLPPPSISTAAPLATVAAAWMVPPEPTLMAPVVRSSPEVSSVPLLRMMEPLLMISVAAMTAAIERVDSTVASVTVPVPVTAPPRVKSATSVEPGAMMPVSAGLVWSVHLVGSEKAPAPPFQENVSPTLVPTVGLTTLLAHRGTCNELSVAVVCGCGSRNGYSN